MSTAFDESKIRRGQPANRGQFAAKHTSAPIAGLASDGEQVVELAWGDPVSLHPDRWDAAARDAYQEGQCLAFATEVAAAAAERYPDADVEVGAFFDGDDEDDRLVHAFAIIRDGGDEWAVDSTGWTELSKFEQIHRDDGRRNLDLEEFPVDEARSLELDSLPEQNYDIARSHTRYVLGD